MKGLICLSITLIPHSLGVLGPWGLFLGSVLSALLMVCLGVAALCLWVGSLLFGTGW